ncbi:MAG TPA: potassium channel family protein [Candidatus Thermoplasmatota archaeon]|nr:potassium channel family protein [Candidatus Thermoplasmatota archaeon]
MTDLLILGAGLGLVGLTLLDAGWTIWWVDGDAGPMTRRLLGGLRALARRPRGRRLRSLLGPASLVATLMAWFVLIGIGWTLVFASDGASLAATGSLPPPGLAAKAYYVAYTLLTMGNGDYVPNGTPWQAATSVAVLSGLVLLTLAITYTMSVLEGVVKKRTTAMRVHALGATPAAIVATGLVDGRPRGFDRMLSSLAEQLALVTEQHLAYPVLHFYDARDRRVSLSLAAALLDDAVTLLASAREAEARPQPLALAEARGAIDRYAAVLARTFVEAEAPPPPPSADGLEARGFGIDPEALGRETATGAKRRARLRGAVEAEGWSWDRDVSGRGA